MFGGLSAKGHLNEFYQPKLSPIDMHPHDIGVAYTKITALKQGVVRLDGCWWIALSIDDMAIQPGQHVRVIGLQNRSLLVERYPYE
ncbi:MAG: hypothetical protein F6K31_33420 [Symploca sp. SIO2G7]|nr:hypothetical protein [Symploca sp. SIO2G7]